MNLNIRKMKNHPPIYMKQTTHYIEKLQSKEHHDLQQNRNPNFVRNLMPIYRRGDTDYTFDMKQHKSSGEQVIDIN